MALDPNKIYFCNIKEFNFEYDYVMECDFVMYEHHNDAVIRSSVHPDFEIEVGLSRN